MSNFDSYAGGLLPIERRASAVSTDTHSSGGHTERGGASTPLQELTQSEMRQRLAHSLRDNAGDDTAHHDAPFGEARKKLRIGFIHPDLGIGGAERLVVDAALGLQARGHDVSIFTSHHDTKHCFEPTRDGTLKVYHMRTRIPRSLPPFHAFHLPLAILQQLSLVIQLIVALALTKFPWLQHVPFLTSATSIHPPDPSSSSNAAEPSAGTPTLPLPPFDLFIFDQLPVGIPLLRLGSATRVAYYCHFPDKEIAKALDRQARADARGINRKVVTAAKILLKTLYRIPFDLLEEVTTDAADRLMVNSNYTASFFLHSFPIIASRLTKEANERDQHVQPGVGSAPKVVYPAVDPTEFSPRWVATELKRLEDADQTAKDRAMSAASATPGSITSKTKARLAKEGSRGILEVRKAIRELCTTKDRPTFVSINRFEAKKNIALAVSAFAELIKPELEATDAAIASARNSLFSMTAQQGAAPGPSTEATSPISDTPLRSNTPDGDRQVGRSREPLRLDTSGVPSSSSSSASSSRSSSTASFARFRQLTQMTQVKRATPRASGGLRLVVAGGYDRRVRDNIQTLESLQAQCDKLGLRHITLSYNPQPFSPPVSPPVYDDLSSAHVIFLQSAPVGCLRALLTNESTISLVYTPAGEHFGIVPLEAAACGLPVLAVNDGGPRESIIDGGVVQMKKQSTSSTTLASSSSSSSVRTKRQTDSRPGTARAEDQATPRGSMTGSRPLFGVGDDDMDTLSNIQPVTLADADEEEETEAQNRANGAHAQPSATTGGTLPSLFSDTQRRKLLIACLKREPGELREEWTRADGTGLLRPNDTEAFYGGMKSMLALWLSEDEGKARKRVAQAAQRRVSEHFGLRMLSQRLEDVAMQCVGMGPVHVMPVLGPIIAMFAMLLVAAGVFIYLDRKGAELAKLTVSKATSAVLSTSSPASPVKTAVSQVVTAAAEAACTASQAVSSVAEAAASAVHVEL
ncbi:hypothetical protein V8E36_003401 [Tilletia maclaganii]